MESLGLFETSKSRLLPKKQKKSLFNLTNAISQQKTTRERLRWALPFKAQIGRSQLKMLNLLSLGRLVNLKLQKNR